MTTGSLCLTEILKSWKSCSSNRLASQTADSTSASGGGLAVLLQQPRVQRAGVDADPDRDAGVLGRLGDLLDLVVELADVAGVDPHRGAAGVDRGEDVLGLEVDVGDDRDLAVPGDLRQRVGVVLARAGDPHDVAAGRGQLGDLLQRRVDVGRRRRASSTAPRSARRRRPRPCRPGSCASCGAGASTGGGSGGHTEARPSCVQYRPRSGRRSPDPTRHGRQPELDRVDDVGVDQQHRHHDQDDATSA